MSWGIKAKLATIVPTRRIDNDGYKTAIITLYDSKMPEEDKIIKQWEIDSFAIYSDKISCDFEGTNGIRMWSHSPSKYLSVVESYGALIYSYDDDNISDK